MRSGLNGKIGIIDSCIFLFSKLTSHKSFEAKQASADLRACLNDLSYENCEQVYGLVNALCAEYERIAFLAGLRLGAQLILELHKKKTN